jgi:hypothetical protein
MREEFQDFGFLSLRLWPLRGARLAAYQRRTLGAPRCTQSSTDPRMHPEKAFALGRYPSGSGKM